jgi:cell division protein FtsL
MNTMARAYSVGTTFGSVRASWITVSARGIAIALLLFSLLLSAIGVVYLKDLNRRLFMQYQELQTQGQQQQLVWSKLLLEQTTLARQSRIQWVAIHKLGMKMPEQSDVVLITLER